MIEQNHKPALKCRVQQRNEELSSANNALVREIEQRKRAETALRDSEAMFRGLIESAPDAMVIVDTDGEIVIVNEQTERMFGYARDELLGKPVEILMPQNKAAFHHLCRTQYKRNPHSRPMGAGQDLYAQHKNGRVFPVEISLAPLKLQSGLLISSAIRDVSYRKRVEAELHQYKDHLQAMVAERTAALTTAMKEMEEFSYTISHDLRSPLRAIDGFSKALVEDYEGRLDETAKDYLARVRAAAQRMGHLIDEVLELSRVSRSDINRDTVDLSAMAGEIIEELQFNDPDKRCEISVHPRMTVNGDTALVRVAMENLLSNAWKFSADKDCVRIEVGARKVEKQTVYYVKDNGVGFDMAYANKLFKPFERLHSKTQFPGTGVGLATVKRIFQRHGGRIWAESVPNEGTIFHFTLNEKQKPQ